MAALLFEHLALVPERSQLVVKHAQRRGDRHVHVEVLVGAQAAAKENLGLLRLGRSAASISPRV